MKEPVQAPPTLDEPLRTVVDVVSSWPGVKATVHWHLVNRSQVDGVDFYVGEEELGHLHVDGSIHLATSPDLGEALVAEGAAKAFRYQAGWVEELVRRIGPDAAVALFRRSGNATSAAPAGAVSARSVFRRLHPRRRARWST